MASQYEVEVKLSSANNLKNVNWRNGPNRPYAVVWVDPNQKRSTNVDDSGDTQANWDEKLTVPIPPGTTIEDSTLFVDVIHAASGSNAQPLNIGSASLRLIEVGVGERTSRTLKLTRPSGRPQGTVDVRVLVKDTGYRAPRAYDTPSYGVSYGAPPPTVPPTGYAAPPTGYSAPLHTGYTGYGAPPPTPYGQPNYGYGQQSYGYGQSGQPSYGYGQSVQTVNVAAPGEKKKSKMGFGAGLAVGAIAGGIGALALEKGVDAIEDKIADRAAEKYEDQDYSSYDF